MDTVILASIFRISVNDYPTRFGLLWMIFVEHSGCGCIRFCERLKKQSIPVRYQFALSCPDHVLFSSFDLIHNDLLVIFNSLDAI
jgi:hypothetical protein